MIYRARPRQQTLISTRTTHTHKERYIVSVYVYACMCGGIKLKRLYDLNGLRKHARLRRTNLKETHKKCILIGLQLKNGEGFVYLSTLHTFILILTTLGVHLCSDRINYTYNEPTRSTQCGCILHTHTHTISYALHLAPYYVCSMYMDLCSPQIFEPARIQSWSEFLF